MMKKPAEKKMSVMPVMVAASFVIGGMMGAGLSSRLAPDDEARVDVSADGQRRLASQMAAGADSHSASKRTGVASKRVRYTQDEASAKLMSVLDQTDSLLRMESMISLIGNMDSAQFSEACQSICDHPLADVRRGELSMLYRAWVQKDPHAAMQHVIENDPAPGVRMNAIAGWAANDPTAAVVWAREQKALDGSEQWLTGVARGIAEQDVNAAKAVLAEIEGAGGQRQALAGMMPYITAGGFESAQTWLASIDDASLQNEAYRMAARKMTDLDAARAGEWASEITDGKTQSQVLAAVSKQWVKTDIEQAQKWVETLPSERRRDAAAELVRELAKTDPYAASDWLYSMGDDVSLSRAQEILAYTAARNNPGAALEGATLIQNEQKRNKHFTTILGRWMKEDPAGAKEWMQVNQEVIPSKVQKSIYK
ncbi:hypothetical protein [Persicirhabdus sediminis]|uniref:Uncharacterized protein n=1 Tax=Persicirhabdus sediminis TaxID=454144 RepID=A0A8J7MCT8_9BACT|nr:hypothetical protein [Persicirhabdus sediminis]MBK1790145.1 hypothetical protein [Persicirhabdus sediminis]